MVRPKHNEILVTTAKQAVTLLPSLPPSSLRTRVKIGTRNPGEGVHKHRDGQTETQRNVSDSSGLQPIQIEHDAGKANVEEEGRGDQLAGDGAPEERRAVCVCKREGEEGR